MSATVVPCEIRVPFEISSLLTPELPQSQRVASSSFKNPYGFSQRPVFMYSHAWTAQGREGIETRDVAGDAVLGFKDNRAR